MEGSGVTKTIHRTQQERNHHVERKPNVKGLRLILLLAVLWLGSGALMGAALRALYGGNWIAPCATINLILGMLLLLWVTRTKQEEEILFEGREREESESSLAAALLGGPMILIFVAIVWGLLALFTE